MNLTITPSAEKFIKRMIRFGGGSAQSGFRLHVSAGGCSGLSSEFSIETAPRPGDSVFETNGVKLFLTVESRLLLDGVTIDFTDTAMSSGLSFIQPNAPAACCGGAPGVSTVAVGSIGRRGG